MVKETEMTANESRKGFVFSLDAIFAVSIMVIFIIASFMMIAKSSEDAYAKLQAVRLGRDLLAVLEKSGKFALWNETEVELTINASLPQDANYYMRLETYVYDNGTFAMVRSDQYGHEPERSRNVYGTRRDFVTRNSSETEYTITRMWIWN